MLQRNKRQIQFWRVRVPLRKMEARPRTAWQKQKEGLGTRRTPHLITAHGKLYNTFFISNALGVQSKRGEPLGGLAEFDGCPASTLALSRLERVSHAANALSAGRGMKTKTKILHDLPARALVQRWAKLLIFSAAPTLCFFSSTMAKWTVDA